MSVSARDEVLESTYQLLDTAWYRAHDKQLDDVRREVGLSITYLETIFQGDSLNQLDDVDSHLETAASETVDEEVLGPLRDARQLLELVNCELDDEGGVES